MKKTLKRRALGLFLPVLCLADISPNAPLMLGFARDAAAIVGMPFTPVSAAGVARRTTRRVVAVETTAATTAAASTTAAAQQQAAAAQQQAAASQQQAAAAKQEAEAAKKEAAAAKQQAAAAPPAPAAAAGAPLPLGTVVAALPAGCTPTPVGGKEYYYCGGTFYRAAFQGNNLVYVTAKPE
jgi:cobalamin biosynthesis Mg chelatase CobN